MCPAHIAFSTPKKPRFLWTDSFEDVGTAELEELLVECRNALHSIDAELAARSDPQVDTNLTNCYAKLQAKALSINRLGALSDQDRTSLEKARTFLGALKSGNIRYSQTRETRKGYGNFERLVWLTSRVAGPAFALLLICSLEKRTLDRLTSSRSTILLKHVVQNCDSLSSRVLEEKAIEFGLNTDATSLLEVAPGTRRQIEHTAQSIAWTCPVFSEDRSKVCDKSRQMEQAGATVLASYHPSKGDGLSPLETGFSSGILIPVSDTANDNDTNGHSTLPGSVIDCDALEPQNQVAAFYRPSLGSHNLSPDSNWSLRSEGILKATRYSSIREDANDNFDGEFLATPVLDLSASTTQMENLPNADIPPILQGSGISNMKLRISGDTMMDNSGHLNPRPMLKLAQDGLIKIKSSSLSGSLGNLQDFYVHSICAGRTLLKDNAYLQEVLPIVTVDAATKYAMIALTSSYYKEYLRDGSVEREKMKNLEIEAITQTMTSLKRNALEGHVYSGDAARMLLIHHAILNQSAHAEHWTKYLYQLQDFPGQQSNLVMARHSIWLMTLLPLNEKYPLQTFNYDWIGCGEEHSLTKVNGILGTSRKMLYFQYLITTAAKFPNTIHHEKLLYEIEQSYQWLDKTETEMATRIALKTAETYKLATKLYALARLCRVTPSHPSVRATCNRLTRELYKLPASGAEYSGLHPAWCFPIACACIEDPEEFAKMDRILEYIGNANKSNVSDLLRLVRWIWQWKCGRYLSGDWWEDLTGYLDLTMNGSLICVS